jgi:peptidoglycan hydrolase-like protein with peptidoglycan-binding domain
MMRVSFFFLTAVLLLFWRGTYANAQATAPNPFTENLSLGSSGTQVLALQQILNRDPDTRIATTGPGSLGNETSYFGSLTKAAVIRFQGKYASAILAPAELTQGNGYVGFYTRVELNALSALPVTTSTKSSAPAIASTSNSTASASTTSQNPNLQNFDIFLAALDKVGTKQGLSSSDIATLKEHALEVVSTTTDLRLAFLEQVQNKSNQSVQNNSFISRALATVEQTFENIFMPERAFAQATGVPFGGALLYAFPCNGGIWNITLSPLPPSFATLLSYTSGSQAFLSYNIPSTDWLLGEYDPGADEACWVGPYLYPSEGMISPETGSSAL